MIQNSEKSTAPKSFLYRLALVTLAIFALQMFSDNRADVDLWGNTGFVTHLPGTQGFHTQNTFSYSNPTYPWINHEWGAEYIFNRAFQLAGNAGLMLVKLALGAALFLILWKTIKRSQCSTPTAFLYMALTVSTLGYGFGTRPHLFTFALIAGLLYVLKFYPGRGWIWWLPLVGMIWANLHGAFFIAVVLLVLMSTLEWLPPSVHRSTDRLRQRTLLPVVTVAFIAATFVNPYGHHLWDFIFESAGLMRPYLSEWAPFNPITDASDHTDFLALIALTVAALCLSKEKHDRTWLIILALVFASALGMRRNIPLFAIVAVFVVPEHLGNVLDPHLSRFKDGLLRRVALCGLILFAAVSLTFTFGKPSVANHRTQIEIDPEKFPVQAMTLLETHQVKGNALIYWDWAEYGIWHLYPNCKVFMDGRLRSAYDLPEIEDYFAFEAMSANWRHAIDNYPTDIVLLNRDKNRIAYMLMLTEPGWTLGYEDELCALFLKTRIHSTLIDTLTTHAITLPQPVEHPVFP